MRINALKIRNYKGFRDSGWLTLGRVFTLVVGQNNVGKTALLEAFRLGGGENKPYRGAMLARNAAPYPTSRFETKVTTSGPELKPIALSRGGVLPWLPIPEEARTNPQRFINTVFSAPVIELEMTTTPGAPSRSMRNPSHALFEKNGTGITARVAISENREKILLSGAAAVGEQDDLVPYLFDEARAMHIYVFGAERLAIGSHAIQDTEFLAPNAANLPAVLLKLQSNPVRWERFNDHVRTIFPAIKRVVVGPLGENLTVFIWSIDLESEREDLAIRLEESGTGVAQVLAILYVAMSRERNVIVIDEPSSFLHPGASNKLMRILKLYGDNQYVISTHSPEVISTIDPDMVHLVKWNGAESTVTQLDGNSLSDMNRLLTDSAVDLADVFGADRVVWVESPVEAKCFPLVADALLGGIPFGWVFAPLGNGGDLRTKALGAGAIQLIRERLTDGPALLPPAGGFSFDREGRTESTIEDIRRNSHGNAHVLPRANYENYLIDPPAIHAVLAGEYARLGLSGAPTVESIDMWIDSHASEYGRGAVGLHPLRDRDWLARCKAPGLLGDLFSSLTEGRIPYNTLSHAIGLTNWTLANAPHRFADLARHVAALTGKSANE